MLHSISEQPLRTNLRKIFREGYHYLTHDGKKFSLTLKDRAAVGWVGRLFNPHKLALRLSLLAIERARHAPAAHMADGYARYSPPPGGEALEAALKVADEKIAIFQRWRAGDRSGVAPADRAAYEAETFKTLHDPLKHAPHRYDEAAARALIRLFLQPELYLTAAEHLGVLPILGGVRLLYSPNEEADRLTNAQLFHIDPEGARQVKVFIAVQDVGPENSPVTFVPERLTAQMLGSGNRSYLSKRVPDELVETHAPRDTWITNEGRRGDMLFVDTSRCLHFGSRPNLRPRLLLYGQYLDPFSSVFPAMKAGGATGKGFRFYQARGIVERCLLAQS